MLSDVEHRAEGNHACIELLENWLGEVKKGKIECCALVVADTPTGYSLGSAGIIGFEFAMLEGLHDMQEKIRGQIKSRQPPAAPLDAPANLVMYNLARMSCSFDFLTWIINAEMTRVREGAPGPLKVGFFHGNESTLTQALSGGARAHNFEHIMRPLIALMGAEEDPDAIVTGRRIDTLAMGPVIDAVNAGEPLPKVVINDESREEIRKHLLDACDGKLPVTITLREADHFPNRNSNVTEWLKFAEWLEARGERVLFIRDTAKSMEPITGFATMPPASQNLFVRTAVYQVAKANLFVSNGPAMLAVMFSERPWLFFTQLTVNNPYGPNTPDGWKYFTGIDSGAQFPWAKRDQRVIYKPDTFEEIRDAWLEHVEPKGVDPAGPVEVAA